ncbi:hypothetical protein HZF08_10585 [Paenibacillus sp. CGMCC 1.16610]|uniref:Uncharacterized protein n=1 Tax=Paenibacillus anseongense TaxID=2682845 RepID=A0ABW9U642_9BACL|nr:MULTISPECIES: hypothetical protein [Paenibacillus]MBA2938752.1 hypothetical protein [Paenibacillus sp. CGMCC 1.16610]MVQ34715.1 hypothetical protein [Paenibacillus anseongense]
MSLNLIQNFSFETGIDPWQNAGIAGTTDPLTGAFEGSRVGSFGPLLVLTPGNAVLSQAFPVEADALNLRVSYAFRRLVAVAPVVNGQFQVQIVWQRGADGGYAPISTEILENMPGTDVDISVDWETHVVVTGPKPALAEQARIRFILFRSLLELGVAGTYIDEVVVTAES